MGLEKLPSQIPATVDERAQATLRNAPIAGNGVPPATGGQLDADTQRVIDAQNAMSENAARKATQPNFGQPSSDPFPSITPGNLLKSMRKPGA
jgi:hypothetical protein